MTKEEALKGYSDFSDSMSKEEYLFKCVVPNKNGWSSDVAQYVQKGKYVCEICIGYFSGYIAAVTVVDTETMTHRHDLSCTIESAATWTSREKALSDSIKYIEAKL